MKTKGITIEETQNGKEAKKLLLQGFIGSLQFLAQ